MLSDVFVLFGCLFLILASPTRVNADCTAMKTCLIDLRDKISDCSSAGRVGVPPRIRQQCGEAVSDLMQEKVELQVERLDSVIQCLETPAEGFEDLEPDEFCRRVFREPGSRVKRQWRRWRQMGKQKSKSRRETEGACSMRGLVSEKNRCKRLADGCDRISLCHLCYEVSGIHDRIKATRYRMMKEEASSCPGLRSGREKKLAFPGRDETFSFVNF